jgi:hypothetical protein
MTVADAVANPVSEAGPKLAVFKQLVGTFSLLVYKCVWDGRGQSFACTLTARTRAEGHTVPYTVHT